MSETIQINSATWDNVRRLVAKIWSHEAGPTYAFDLQEENVNTMAVAIVVMFQARNKYDVEVEDLNGDRIMRVSSKLDTLQENLQDLGKSVKDIENKLAEIERTIDTFDQNNDHNHLEHLLGEVVTNAISETSVGASISSEAVEELRDGIRDEIRDSTEDAVRSVLNGATLRLLA